MSAVIAPVGDKYSYTLSQSQVTHKSESIGFNAQNIINKRYSTKDETGKPTETWPQICKRVADSISTAEENPTYREIFATKLQQLIESRIFLPNTPCLVNAGKPNAQLAACFVLGVSDSIKGIMETATHTATIHQTGGGTGFTFENLRPAGALVRSTHGVASGPVSFMEIFDKVTDVVKQGGVRRGANMGILRCDHPDVLRFIHAKNNQHKLTNFNISVSVTDEFMEAVKNRQFYQTKFDGRPWTHPVHDPLETTEIFGNSYDAQQSGQLYAPAVWDRIIRAAHEYAEPGVIFIDTVNKHNLLKSMGPITASNPCGEQMLHSNNSCNLGSIDLSKFFISGPTHSESFDWDNFRQTIYWATRFLDNVIDVCVWPVDAIEETVKKTRPVGLGVMGFANLLIKMGVSYGSDTSIKILNSIMEFFQREAWVASCEIGLEKGAFPEYYANQVGYDEFLSNKMGIDISSNGYIPRNYEVTTVAPTGTISLVAETSSGIEPNFGWVINRVDTVNNSVYVHPLAASELGIELGTTEPELLRAAEETQARLHELPNYFVNAHDCDVHQHLNVLAAAQAGVDNSVSKTCNGHSSDTVEQVEALYLRAYEMGIKAMSYYRDGSRDGQVLTVAPTCPECKAALKIDDSCQTCLNCGYGQCAVA